MPVILGIYLIIPFLSRLANDGYLELKKSLIPLLAACILLFLLPTLNFILSANIPGYQKLAPQMDISVLGGYYVFYVIMGYVIVRYEVLKKLKWWHILLIGAVCLAGITWMVRNRLDFENLNMSGVIWYNSIFIAIMSMLAFELCRRLKDKIPGMIAKWSEKIAKLSLGIYFIHLMIIKTFTKFVTLNFLPVPGRIGIVLIVSFLLSYLIVYLLCKNRRIGKILCYYKGWKNGLHFASRFFVYNP